MSESYAPSQGVHACRKQKVQLVCTGPLTNAALLLSVFPSSAQMVDITFMGGSMAEGNTGPVAEFNIQVNN